MKTRIRNDRTSLRVSLFAFAAFTLLVALGAACANNHSTQTPGGDNASVNNSSPSNLDGASWESLVTRARGTTVNFAMWYGDARRNRYFEEQVAARLKSEYDITLRIVPLGDTAEAINKLLNEREAEKTTGGSIDMLWINGENFRTAKRANLLAGSFADSLPNIEYFDAGARTTDFGTPVEGFEAPWQRAQFVMAYDAARITDAPRSIEALRDWIKAHPGRFTYPAPPDFTGSVFLRHVLFHFGGGANAFQGKFNEALYRDAAAKTIAYLDDIKPFLWRAGETYPQNPRELDRLFANSEIDFSMSYAPGFASERIKRGEFPSSARTFVFDEGTIGTYSYLTIPFNAANPAGARVVINDFLSPAHLIEQTRELGGVFPIALERLTPEERHEIERLPRDEATLSIEELRTHLVPEADAEYLERLERDWLEKVLRRQ